MASGRQMDASAKGTAVAIDLRRYTPGSGNPGARSSIEACAVPERYLVAFSRYAERGLLRVAEAHLLPLVRVVMHFG
jgi:hypothetical protein